MESKPVGTCKMWSFLAGGLYIQVISGSYTGIRTLLLVLGSMPCAFNATTTKSMLVAT